MAELGVKPLSYWKLRALNYWLTSWESLPWSIILLVCIPASHRDSRGFSAMWFLAFELTADIQRGLLGQDCAYCQSTGYILTAAWPLGGSAPRSHDSESISPGRVLSLPPPNTGWHFPSSASLSPSSSTPTSGKIRAAGLESHLLWITAFRPRAWLYEWILSILALPQAFREQGVNLGCRDSRIPKAPPPVVNCYGHGEKMLSWGEDSLIAAVICGLKQCPPSSFETHTTTNSVMFLSASCYKWLGSFGVVNPGNFSRGRKREFGVKLILRG